MNGPFKIGSKLINIKTNKIIILERYDTQFVISLNLSGRNRKPNYNYLYGRELETNTKIGGLSKEFVLYQENKSSL